MADINLLPEKNFLTPKERRRRRLIFLTVGLTSAIFFSVFGGLLAYRTYLKAQINSGESQKAALMSDLETQKALALDLRTVKEKVRGIKTVKSSQIDLAGRLSQTQGFLPNGAKLNSLYLGEDDALTANVFLPGVAALGPFINQLTSQSGSEILGNIKLFNLGYTSDSVSLNLSAKFIPNKNP